MVYNDSWLTGLNIDAVKDIIVKPYVNIDNIPPDILYDVYSYLGNIRDTQEALCYLQIKGSTTKVHEVLNKSAKYLNSKSVKTSRSYVNLSYSIVKNLNMLEWKPDVIRKGSKILSRAVIVSDPYTTKIKLFNDKPFTKRAIVIPSMVDSNYRGASAKRNEYVNTLMTSAIHSYLEKQIGDNDDYISIL